MFVGLLVCLFVCFLSATRHLSTLRAASEYSESSRSRRGRPRERGGQAHAQREHARACRTTSPRKNRCADAFQKKTVRGRVCICCRIRNCRDFQKKGKRKPTCHFPSSVYSLPSLGVFTFRIVLNRILHKSSRRAGKNGNC